MAADPERTEAITRSVERTLRFAADELKSSPDRTASKLMQAETQLSSSDAAEHLSAETIAKFRAEIASLQKQVEDAERAEKAGRIEREIKRVLSQLEDEIRTSGSQIESVESRATAKLAAPEVRENLTPESIAALEQQLNELRAKAGIGAPAAPPPAPAPPPPVAAPPVAAAPVSQAATSTPPSAGLSEEAQRTLNSITRTIRMAGGEMTTPSWTNAGGYISQAESQIDGDMAKQHLSADLRDQLRGQVAELQQQYTQRKDGERIEETENFLRRLLSDAESDVDAPDRIGRKLERVEEALGRADHMPADRVAFYKSEIARLGSAAGGTARKKAIAEATSHLEELEREVTDTVFDGLGEYEAGKVWGGFDTLKDRVGWALERVEGDDDETRAIRSRLDAALARRDAAYASTKRTADLARATASWEETLAKVAGWENEEQDTSAALLGKEILPATWSAVRALRDALTGDSLFTPIAAIRKEYPDDPTLAKIAADGERMINAGFAKMVGAFDAIMDAAERVETPTIESERRDAESMAHKARDMFEGTEYQQPRVARANALFEHWETTVAAANAAREEYYARLSGVAASAWPAIVSKIKAHDGFNPSDDTWRGKTVRINGLRNRVGWDFGNAYHLAIWVNDTPVAGDFEPNVLEAFQAAQNETRTNIDDHTDWDAVVVVEGVGKVKQRIKKKVKLKGETVGEIEEWLPVDCRLCKVIALRAGPVAVGPA